MQLPDCLVAEKAIARGGHFPLALSLLELNVRRLLVHGYREPVTLLEFVLHSEVASVAIASVEDGVSEEEELRRPVEKWKKC